MQINAGVLEMIIKGGCFPESTRRKQQEFLEILAIKPEEKRYFRLLNTLNANIQAKWNKFPYGCFKQWENFIIKAHRLTKKIEQQRISEGRTVENYSR